MKFGRLRGYNMGNIFLEKSIIKCGGEATIIHKTLTFEGELHSNYIFLHFTLIGLEWDPITGARKNAPGKNAPRKNVLGKSAPQEITPRK